jgi:hypothetical protein
VAERKSFQRQIMYLMNAIKLDEFEQSFTYWATYSWFEN